MATEEKDNSMWTNLKGFLGGSVMVAIAELHALMPDSILFGSLLLYALTQNMAFGIFTLFLFESIMTHKLISWISTQSMGSSESRTKDMKCRMGYKTPQFAVNRMFTHNQYPSYGVFSITAMATYLGLATKEFADTMAQMGPEWDGRVMVAYFFIAFMMVAFVGCRVAFCGETAGEIIIAMFLAVFSAVLFFFLHKTVFGVESVNFLGLPFMTAKQSKGEEIYVCAKE
jgi:hypothetical protein